MRTRACNICLYVQLRAHAHHVWLIKQAHHLGRTYSVISSFLGWIFCWSMITGRKAVWSFHCTKKEKHLLCSLLCRRHWPHVISLIDLGMTQGKLLKSIHSPWCGRKYTQVFNIYPTWIYFIHLKIAGGQCQCPLIKWKFDYSRWNHVVFQVFNVRAWFSSVLANVFSNPFDLTQNERK